MKIKTITGKEMPLEDKDFPIKIEGVKTDNGMQDYLILRTKAKGVACNKIYGFESKIKN